MTYIAWVSAGCETKDKAERVKAAMEEAIAKEDADLEDSGIEALDSYYPVWGTSES